MGDSAVRTGTSSKSGRAGARGQPVGDSPAVRRPAIDVARILALVAVVLGHLILAVVDRPGGVVRGENLLSLWPEWAFLAAAAPMPVFFAAGGWAHAASRPLAAAPRLRALVGLAGAVVAVWSAAVVIGARSGEAGVVADGARIATQPLWFLAAYVPLAAAGGALGRLAARRPFLAVGVPLATLAAGDLFRFALGAGSWIGWPGFFLAWAVPWLVGGWWRDREESGRLRQRRAGLVLAGAAGGTAAVLVGLFGYAPGLIDVTPGSRSNTTPPNLYTAVMALAQVGALMALSPWLDRLGRRWRRLWSAAGEAAVGVYLWHLSALALCVAALALGVPAPERLTPGWWATRPLWFGAVLTVTAALVLTSGAGRAGLGFLVARLGPLPGAPSRDPSSCRLAFGVLVTVGAAATVGLVGPRSVALAFGCTGMFLGAWWLLGGAPRREAR